MLAEKHFVLNKLDVQFQSHFPPNGFFQTMFQSIKLSLYTVFKIIILGVVPRTVIDAVKIQKNCGCLCFSASSKSFSLKTTEHISFIIVSINNYLLVEGHSLTKRFCLPSLHRNSDGLKLLSSINCYDFRPNSKFVFRSTVRFPSINVSMFQSTVFNL